MTMTLRQKKVIKAINKQIIELRRAKHEAMTSGVANATLSGAGNSQSYARWKPSDFDSAISNLEREKAGIMRGSKHRRTAPSFN